MRRASTPGGAASPHGAPASLRAAPGACVPTCVARPCARLLCAAARLALAGRRALPSVLAAVNDSEASWPREPHPEPLCHSRLWAGHSLGGWRYPGPKASSSRRRPARRSRLTPVAHRLSAARACQVGSCTASAGPAAAEEAVSRRGPRPRRRWRRRRETQSGGMGAGSRAVLAAGPPGPPAVCDCNMYGSHLQIRTAGAARPPITGSRQWRRRGQGRLISRRSDLRLAPTPRPSQPPRHGDPRVRRRVRRGTARTYPTPARSDRLGLRRRLPWRPSPWPPV